MELFWCSTEQSFLRHIQHVHGCSRQFQNCAAQIRNCAAQIRNCVIVSCFQNWAVTFAYFEIAREHTANLFCLWLEGTAHPLGWGENIWWAEMHTFSPRSWTLSYGVSLEWLHNLLSLIFQYRFGHFDWDSILVDHFKTLSLIIDAYACCPWSLFRLCWNFEIALHNFKIVFCNFKIG